MAKRKPSVIRHDDVEQEILRRISEGEPLAVICRSDPLRFPTPMSWGRWVDGNAELAIAYARAREVGFDAIAADALEIIDAEPERIISVDSDGERSSERRDGASVQWAKNRFEARLKLLAKWDPKRYGDKQLLGSDPDNPLPTGLTVTFRKTDAD